MLVDVAYSTKPTPDSFRPATDMMTAGARETVLTIEKLVIVTGFIQCRILYAAGLLSSATHKDVVFSNTNCHGLTPAPVNPGTRRFPVTEFSAAVTCAVGRPLPIANTAFHVLSTPSEPYSCPLKMPSARAPRHPGSMTQYGRITLEYPDVLLAPGCMVCKPP